MRRRGTGVLVAAVLSLSASAVQAQDLEPTPWVHEPNARYGPFQYQSLALFPSLRSGFETHFPAAFPAGSTELRLSENWVKNLSEGERWRMDFEVLQTNVVFSVALSDEIRIDAGFVSSERTGGALDALILGFHRAFDLPLESRSHFARNENRIEIQPPGGAAPFVVDQHDPQPFDEAALLTVEHALTAGDEDLPAVTWSLTVRRKLRSGDLREGSPVDVGASLAIAKEFGDVYAYLGGRFAWFGEDRFVTLKLRTTEWSGTLAVEWALGTNFSLIAQYLITSGGADSMGALSRPSHEVLAGFKWEVHPGVMVELSLLENVFVFDNSPDFGVRGGITLRW